MVDYLSSQPNRAGYQVSTKQGSGPITAALKTDMAKPNERDIERTSEREMKVFSDYNCLSLCVERLGKLLLILRHNRLQVFEQSRTVLLVAQAKLNASRDETGGVPQIMTNAVVHYDVNRFAIFDE